MQLLSKFFPYVEVVFSENGVSSSEAQRRKEDNKNKNTPLLAKLSFSLDKLYVDKTECLGVDNSITETTLAEVITPSDFDVLEDIAERNAESAMFGFGLNTKKNLLDSINTLSYDHIAHLMGFEKPNNKAVLPTKNNAIKVNNVSWFCTLEEVEELFIYSSKELLSLLGKDHYTKAMQLEAQASVYGNHVAIPDSFLRKLNAASKTLKPREVSLSNSLLRITPILKVNKEEFVEKDNELMVKYTEYQTQRNGLVKLHKDKARELQRQYDEQYSTELAKYNSAVVEYNNEVKLFESKCETIKTQLTQEVAALKIRVA